MATFEFALVILFWAAVVLSVTSIMTPSAAFLCRKKTRLRGVASWLCLALVVGTINMSVASVNTIF